VPAADSPDTLHALLCRKHAPDSLKRQPWLGVVYHDRARVDTIYALRGGGPR